MNSQKCDFESRIPDYLEGILADKDKAAFEAHINSCEACRIEIAKHNKLKALIENIEYEKAPESLRRRIIIEMMSAKKPARILGIIPPRSIIRFAEAVAALLILVVGFHIYNDRNAAAPLIKPARKSFAQIKMQDVAEQKSAITAPAPAAENPSQADASVKTGAKEPETIARLKTSEQPQETPMLETTLREAAKIEKTEDDKTLFTLDKQAIENKSLSADKAAGSVVKSEGEPLPKEETSVKDIFEGAAKDTSEIPHEKKITEQSAVSAISEADKSEEKARQTTNAYFSGDQYAQVGSSVNSKTEEIGHELFLSPEAKQTAASSSEMPAAPENDGKVFRRDKGAISAQAIMPVAPTSETDANEAAITSSSPSSPDFETPLKSTEIDAPKSVAVFSTKESKTATAKSRFAKNTDSDNFLAKNIEDKERKGVIEETKTSLRTNKFKAVDEHLVTDERRVNIIISLKTTKQPLLDMLKELSEITIAMEREEGNSLILGFSSKEDLLKFLDAAVDKKWLSEKTSEAIGKNNPAIKEGKPLSLTVNLEKTKKK